MSYKVIATHIMKMYYTLHSFVECEGNAMDWKVMREFRLLLQQLPSSRFWGYGYSY